MKGRYGTAPTLLVLWIWRHVSLYRTDGTTLYKWGDAYIPAEKRPIVIATAEYETTLTKLSSASTGNAATSAIPVLHTSSLKTPGKDRHFNFKIFHLNVSLISLSCQLKNIATRNAKMSSSSSSEGDLDSDIAFSTDLGSTIPTRDDELTFAGTSANYEDDTSQQRAGVLTSSGAGGMGMGTEEEEDIAIAQPPTESDGAGEYHEVALTGSAALDVLDQVLF